MTKWDFNYMIGLQFLKESCFNKFGNIEYLFIINIQLVEVPIKWKNGKDNINVGKVCVENGHHVWKDDW